MSYNSCWVFFCSKSTHCFCLNNLNNLCFFNTVWSNQLSHPLSSSKASVNK
nr:MAG TPA: hypothetical protein [Caudoviricetes sp.]